jgi:hypothetical protein
VPSLIPRRTLLLTPLALHAQPARVTRNVFLPSPGKGTAVMAYAFYTKPRGGEMLSIEQRWSRSDTIDVAYYRRSTDHGRTWSAPLERKTGERTPHGMLRTHPRGGWVDPATGRYLEIWTEGVLPTDDPLEGMRQWNIYYSVAGGPKRQVIHKGAEYNPRHPLPGVFTGKNSVMLGDNTCLPIAGPRGEILLPAQLTPLAPDGSLYNPAGGYTYHDSVVLTGRWRGRHELEWEMSDRIVGDPKVSTRGMVEPTIARINGGRILMILRGSNDRDHTLPSRKWISISSDGGWRWSKPLPWTYTSGESFYSPSSCSQLLPHPNGKLYWLGNINPENPRGNRPRFPFFCGEVDPNSGLLIRDSLVRVDDKTETEDPILSLSNFYAREDRQTGGIALHMTRLFAFDKAWEGDAMLYRIR